MGRHKESKTRNTLGDVGNAIQNFAEKSGYSVVREFLWAWNRQSFHTAPNILHYGEKGKRNGIKKRYDIYN